MALWEYKVITSGKGGFATPALLEKFLNDLGREEWEIVEFRAAPDNALAFTGLARRSTQRDWTLEDAAAAAAKVEAEKLRAEFAAKFQAATTAAPASDEAAAGFLEEKLAPDDGFRKPVDTSRDNEPDAPEEEVAEKDEWERLEQEDELPSFFEALKPHMRRNQRGPGMSVGVDFLAKKWGLDESDIRGALVECGLQIPADENAKPVNVEYDGDLYWVNINRRGEVWINTREKPRPVFRVVQATRVAPETPEEPKSETAGPRPENIEQRALQADSQPELPAIASESATAKPEAPTTETAPATPGKALPQGPALLGKIRPLMRRNRRGGGGSGSTSFLARALRSSEADLIAGFAAIGLVLPATPADPAVDVEIGNEVWWLNKDSRGGVWINGREKRAGEVAKPAGAEPASAAVSVEVAPAQESPTPSQAMANEAVATAPQVSSPLAAVRLLLKETRTGSVAGKVDRVAGELGKSPEELVASLVVAGLKVPEKPREKPVFVEHAGEIFWFNQNAKGELWVNAKASKFAGKDTEAASATTEGEKKPSRRGGRGRKGGIAPAGDAAPAA